MSNPEEMAKEKYTDNLISQNKELLKRLIRAEGHADTMKVAYDKMNKDMVQACAQRDEMKERAAKYIKIADDTIAELHKKFVKVHEDVAKKLYLMSQRDKTGMVITAEDITEINMMFPQRIGTSK